MSRILGIDFGEKRIGVAISDESGKFALPHDVVANTPDLIEDIRRLTAKHKINTIVIGESHNFKGEPNPIMDSINSFKRQLEKSGFIVIFEPEFLSSVQAGRWQGQTEKLDASAAAVILQSYLDRQTK